MKENNQRNSRKRLNALILLVAFTAILLIVSTYAWFSTQKNVTLSGLEGQVNVAEGLQISLDALNWANSIDLSKTEEYFAQTNSDLNLDGTPGKEKMSLEHPYANRTNIIPTELLPASTTAKAASGENTDDADGIGLADINFYRGENTEGIKLTLGNTALTNDKTSGFYAIDFFLQNSSAATATKNDILQLTGNSVVSLKTTSKATTGLQNTLRVAFAIFDYDTAKATQVTVNETPNQSQILEATTGASRKITNVAIWEPNASGAALKEGGEPATKPSDVISTYAAHVTYIVQNNNRVTFSEADRTAFGLTSNRFAANSAIPTYALTKKALATTADTPKVITDIYNWDTTAATGAGLARQFTLQTPNTGVSSTTGAGVDKNINYDDTQGAVKLVSAKDGKSEFSIEPGKYVRMRMYIWLEGQDVDCINYASLGGNVKIDVGLSKPGTTTTATEEGH